MPSSNLHEGRPKKKSCHRSGLSNSLTKTKVVKLIGLPGLVFSHLCFGTVFVFVVVVVVVFFLFFVFGGGGCYIKGTNTNVENFV